MSKGRRASRAALTELGDQRHAARSRQQRLPTKGMYFKEDVCGEQLGSSETLPRTRSSLPGSESLAGSAQAGLVRGWGMCSAGTDRSLAEAACDVQPGRQSPWVWVCPP